MDFPSLRITEFSRINLIRWHSVECSQNEQHLLES
jgi:hypothetical protein